MVFQGAGSFFAVVASMCCGGLISVQYFLVVFLNDSFQTFRLFSLPQNNVKN